MTIGIEHVNNYSLIRFDLNSNRSRRFNYRFDLNGNFQFAGPSIVLRICQLEVSGYNE